MKGVAAAVAEFLRLLNWWLPRRAAKKESPVTKDAEARKKIENEILNDDEAAANARVHDALYRLRMRQQQAKGDKRGQGD